MKKYRLIAALLLLIFVAGCGRTAEEDGVKERTSMVITAEEAKKIMDSGENCVILDVREEEEYAQGHIDGAILIPYGEIEDRAEKELLDKNLTILVYCRSGRRSAIAAESLVRLGYTDVRDFGGILDWNYEVVVD